jgi:hypothetical protein
MNYPRSYPDKFDKRDYYAMIWLMWCSFLLGVMLGMADFA